MGKVRGIMMFCLTASSISTACAQSVSEVGRTYEIRRSYETSSKHGDESSGSSSGHDTILERVVAERDGGLELEFDYPAGTSKEDRARDWQLPVRVFRAADRTFSLIDRPLLEKRIDSWLKRAKIDRRACGSWYFTWNAFKVECDPLSVLNTVVGFDIRIAPVATGQLYKADGAIAAVPLRKGDSVLNETSLVADSQLDPVGWQRQAAEADVVIGQITREPLTIGEALQRRAKEQVSGTIKVQLALSGTPLQVMRQTTTTEITIKSADGPAELRTKQEVIERKLLN